MTDTMRIWDAVSKTDPRNTKKVNQRGGFTSICAQSQVMAATRQFGPIGEGWGYDADAPIFHEGLVFVRVTLWHGDRANRFGPITGGAEWRDSKGRLDSDAPKKATTDALTKLLSQLGFNADVFLGLFDDNKYVELRMQEVEREESPLVTDAQRETIEQLAAETGTSLKAICEAYKIASIKDLPAGAFGAVKKRLEDRKNKPIAKKEAA